MDPLFQIPEDLGALSADELRTFIDSGVARVEEIAGDPGAFAVEGRSLADVRTETAAAVEAIKTARESLAALEANGDGGEAAEPAEGDGGEEPAEGDEPADGDEPTEGDEETTEEPSDELAAEFAELAQEAGREVEPVARTAAAAPVRRARPARSRAHRPQPAEEPRVSLVAAAGVDTLQEGDAFPSEIAIAEAMIRRRSRFGMIAEGSEENVPIARADWSALYDSDRVLGKDEERNAALVAAVIDDKLIRSNFEARRKQAGGSLVASGGLCAPVTPYYNLAMVSSAVRPVRAALPAFNADRGGIRYARPATLASITTGVGYMTAAQDAAGGTSGTKSCQVVDCPPFQETDVAVIYHCLRFGNLGARTFPERVAQWNQLTLAAQARLAERALLSAIDAFSTPVLAHAIAAGASGELLSEILVAAAGMRSRHRMDPQAILRIMLPAWALDLVVSDVYRSQFGRWDMTREKFVGLLREANVEPSFYIDSAAGENQEFGVQEASGTCSSSRGDLLPFPFPVTWYLFPEGSFLFIDGGVLELGLVRDSVLNSTNDFEIFGESFENVAFIGVESLAVTSFVADIGLTAGTSIVGSGIDGPVDYCDPLVQRS
jgi:hypothetical protein